MLRAADNRYEADIPAQNYKRITPHYKPSLLKKIVRENVHESR